MNVTMVACYGDKPPALAQFIEAAQAQLGGAVASFVPYGVWQVHATIVGLEGRRPSDGGDVLNANYLALRGERRRMDLPRAFELVRRSACFPFRIQIGGFLPGGTPQFLSRGCHPHERSFSFSGETAVAMGWPRVDGTHPAPLARLRRGLESAGILHKYHAAADASDDDFFFVLGHVRREDATEDSLRAAANELRASMARAPIEVVVEVRDICVVGYVDPALSPETSVRYGLSDADAESVLALYPVGE